MLKNILAGAPVSRSWISDRLQTRVVVRTMVTLMIMVTILMILTSVTKAIMAGQGLMWSVAADAPVKLVVCWENLERAEPLPAASSSTSGAQRREWVRLALKSSWERYARVLFIGWEECKDEEHAIPPPHTHGPRRPGTGDENIKVTITTSGGGQNPAHGSWGDHQKSGILLNLQESEANTKFLAIHEFGHALGFYHGEERSDWPSTTQCPEQWSSLEPNDVWWPQRWSSRTSIPMSRYAVKSAMEPVR